MERPTDEQVQRLLKLLLARVILFNRRRVSEVEEIKVSDFACRVGDTPDDIFDALDIFEQAIAKRMSVIEVRGKSTRSIRKVFVLLSSDLVRAIDYVLRKRNYHNPYVFGRRGCPTPIDGCQAMRYVLEQCPNLK